MSDKCKNCYYAVQRYLYVYGYFDDCRNIECRRKSPSCFGYPKVSEDDWCGEFKNKYEEQRRNNGRHVSS